MSYHKLLQKQINKYLTEECQKHPLFQNFIYAVNESYVAYERDKELLNHAFSISEKEYQNLYENLNREYDLKNISIEKLKTALKNIEKENDSKINLDSDDLLVIVDYINSEIQKRKETEDSLNRTLKLLTTLLSNLNSGILVEDENRKILYSNQLFCDMFSISASPDQLTGLDCSDSAEQNKSTFINPIEFVDKIKAILENKVPVFNDELVLVDSRVFERDYIPIFINNEYKGHLWDYRDITERKNAEAKLKASLKETSDYKYAMDNAAIIAITDQEGNITYANDIFCKISKYSLDELIGKNHRIINSGFHSKDFFKEMYKTIANGKIWRGEIKNKAKDGSYYWVDSTITPFMDDNGKPYQYLAIRYDITERKKFEAKLLDITKVQEAILNGTDYSIIYTETNGLIKSFNKGAENMLGYKANEVIDICTPQIFHDVYEVIEKSKQLSVELEQTIKPGFDVFIEKAKNDIIDTNEWTYITKSGDRLTVLLSVSALRNSHNELIGFMGIARDITKQKEVQKALQNSEERYRNIVEKSTDIIYRINMFGYFSYVNSVAERITGYSQEELLHKHYTDLIKEDSKNAAIAFYKDQIKNRKTTTYYEFPIITKSGEERYIGQSVQLSELNRRDFELTALAIDVTERKNFEKNIFLQKEKYLNIITNMNLGLLEVDLNENIQFANPGFEFISGYKESELIGKNAAKLFISDSHSKLIESKSKIRSRGLSDMYEVPIKNKNGELKWWMISGAPNYDEKGNLIGSIGIHLDITEQKQLELDLELAKSRAEESSKAKEAFLANMSHEIRTPLNAIIGMIRELSKEKLSEKQLSYVENTSIASQHLLSVLNNILDISKIEAGELQLDMHHYDLQKLLNDVKSIMLSKCTEKGLYLKINHTENKNTFFVGDSSRFRQILLNLIGNAVKFTDNGGITVDYDVQDIHQGYQAVFISVSDSGVGMDESYLKNIFNKFSQEDSSTSRKYGGSGLGMSITKELVQLMNGTIEIKSKKNQGTSVYMKFLIPIGDQTKLLKEDMPDNIDNDIELEILLVEDNEFNRLVAGNTLSYFNCHVTEAVNGLEAINILKTGKRFDIILMDLQMPIMDGFESTSIIRNELKINTPIIALTANAFKSELEQCMNIGMNDCVTKPFEEEKLIGSIYKLTKLDAKKDYVLNEMQNDSNQKLYNLNQLLSVSRNDSAYCKKMISIFIEQSTTAISQINESYDSKDLSVIYSIAHRIKPSIDLMGIDILRDNIRYIEKNSKELNDSEELKKQINILFTVLNKVINQLKEEVI